MMVRERKKSRWKWTARVSRVSRSRSSIKGRTASSPSLISAWTIGDSPRLTPPGWPNCWAKT